MERSFEQKTDLHKLTWHGTTSGWVWLSCGGMLVVCRRTEMPKANLHQTWIFTFVVRTKHTYVVWKIKIYILLENLASYSFIE